MRVSLDLELLGLQLHNFIFKPLVLILEHSVLISDLLLHLNLLILHLLELVQFLLVLIMLQTALHAHLSNHLFLLFNYHLQRGYLILQLTHLVSIYVTWLSLSCTLNKTGCSVLI